MWTLKIGLSISVSYIRNYMVNKDGYYKFVKIAIYLCCLVCASR